MKTRFNFDNSYAEQLEGFYTAYIGEKAPSPKLLKFQLKGSSLRGRRGRSLRRSLRGRRYIRIILMHTPSFKITNNHKVNRLVLRITQRAILTQ